MIGKLEKPAVMGHSTGRLFAQMLAGRGLSAATVAIDPGVFRGVTAALSTLKASGRILLNPRGQGRAICITFDQFKYGWTNALDSEDEQAPLRRLPRGRVGDRPGPVCQRQPQPGPSRRSTRRT